MDLKLIENSYGCNGLIRSLGNGAIARTAQQARIGAGEVKNEM